MSSVFSKVVNTLLHTEDVLLDGNTGHRLLACLSTTVVNFFIIKIKLNHVISAIVYHIIFKSHLLTDHKFSFYHYLSLKELH